MTKKSSIKVLKKMTLPVLLGSYIGIPAAFAEKPPGEQAKYESCQSTKHSWIFENFNPFQPSVMEHRRKSIEEFELQLRGIDPNRISRESAQSLFDQATKLGIPTDVAESALCIERFRRNYPEDEKRDFNCGQSCAVTVR